MVAVALEAQVKMLDQMMQIHILLEVAEMELIFMEHIMAAVVAVAALQALLQFHKVV